MGEANRKRAAEQERAARRASRKVLLKRFPKAIFWATTYPFWLWFVFFAMVMKEGKSPLETMDN